MSVKTRLFVFCLLISGLMLSVQAQDRAKNQNPELNLERGPKAFVQVLPEKWGVFDADAYRQQQRKLFDQLVADQSPLSDGTIISSVLTDEDRAGLERANCVSCGAESRKVAVGINKTVGVGVDFTNLTGTIRLKAPRIESHGMMRSTPDGGYVWTAAAEAKDAVAMRIHFVDFSLPEHAALYVYNSEGQAFGPYTHRGPNGTGDFWSNTLNGSLAFIQLRHRGVATRQDLEKTVFVMEEIGHLGPKFLRAILMGNEPVHRKTCSFNASCVENASCFGTGTWGAINDVSGGVASILYASRGFLYICSGGLLADTDTGTTIPYFLTANHCISKGREASSMEAFFQFTTPCNGACYNPDGVVPSTNGSSVVSTSKTSDYTLLELSQMPPSGSTYLGWNSSPVANTNGVELYRLSHPQGAPQSFSKHTVDTSTGTCSSWPRGNWIYSRDVIGATEGGSSGSPVLNVAGQVVGQLSGACGFDVNNPCNSVDNATVDGAFAAYFSSVSQFLDPNPGGGGTTMHVASIVPSLATQGPWRRGVATVTIVDVNNNPVSNATVSGTFSGDFSGGGSGTTDSNGVAVIQSGRNRTGSSFTFCVDNVSHGSNSYNSGANAETCDTL